MAQDDIQGTVVDSSGNPVSGAVVEVAPARTDASTAEDTVVRTTTDANGDYIIETHPYGDGTTQDWHVSAYYWDGSAWVNSLNKPGVSADLRREIAIPDSVTDHWPHDEGSGSVVANAEGSIDIDLIGASWQSISNHGGWATYYDGVDDEFTTASQGSFNEQEYSYAMWVRPDSWDNYAFFAAAVDSIDSQGADNGWGIRTFDGDELALRHADSSPDTVTATSTGFISPGTWYFIGVAGNGDSAAMHIWDETQELFSSTGSGTRGGVGQNRPIEGMFDDRLDPDRGPVEGLVGENFAARGTEMTKIEFEDLWNATKP